MEEYIKEHLEELIEAKAKIDAIKAYVGATNYLSSKVLKSILGMEITEDDD